MTAAGTGTLIKIAAETHTGGFNLDADKKLTLQGGWDKTFSNPNGGTTTLKGAENQGIRFSRLLFLKGLVDFETANLEPHPITFWHVDWDDLKKALTSEVKHMAQEIC